MPQEELIDEAKGFKSREDTMDNILASREDDLKQEVEDSGGELLPDKDEDDTPDKSDDTQDDKADDDKADVKEPDPEPDETVDLIVDGETKTMKVSEVVKIAQKNMAADARLAEAEKKNREADEHLKSKTEEVVEPDKKNDELRDEKRKAYLHAMNYGEPEEQEEALIEWENVRWGDGEQTNTKDLEERITANIKQELTGDQINDRFDLPVEKGGFGDIRSNPRLMKMCWDEIQIAIEAGADGSKWETYRDIAADIRKEFLDDTKPDKPASDAFEEKKKRKLKVDNLESVSDTKSSGSKESNPQSSEGLRSGTIAELAQGRPGQANY
jgi:hypothetical protein